jgi:hypothetical protein
MSPIPSWLDVHARDPRMSITDDILSAQNIRSVDYVTHNEESGYTCTYLDHTYDMRTLAKVWFIENHYAFLQSHIILSFEFTNPAGERTYITVSAEVRKKSLLDFKVWHVFFKTFPVFYILAPESDVVYLRTNIRHTPVNMYELALDPAAQKRLRTEVARAVTAADGTTIPYRVGRSDCVTTLMHSFRAAGIPIKKYFWDTSPTKVLYRSGLIRGAYTSAADVYTKTLINTTVAASTQANYSRTLHSS